jgi:Tetratricopeptide repeat
MQGERPNGRFMEGGLHRQEVFMLSIKARRVLFCAALAALSSLLASCRGGSAPPQEDWDRQVKEAQERGAPLVRAIYKFHATCGLWPCSLDELVPDYAGAQQVQGWGYAWRPSGWWSLKHYGAFPKALICYQHRDADEAGWYSCTGEDDDARLAGGEVDVPAADVSAEEKDAAHLALLRARVGRYKNRIIHHRGLICWYYTHGDYDSAREACEKCLRRWPDHWWPNLMMAYIEFKLGRIEDADARLARFTADHDDLSHWYLAAVFHLEAGQPEKARKELARAAKVPLADVSGKGSSDDGEVLGYSTGAGIAWRAAGLCYRRGWFDEALAVADQWEQCEKKVWAGYQYGAFQAACYLALGQEEKAREPLHRIMEERKTHNVGLENLDALEKAIERKDHDYRFDPGDNPFSILVEYE